MEEKRVPTMRDIGRLGGQRTAAKYGPEHFEAIGKVGGERVRQMVKRALEMEKAQKG